MTSRLLRVPRGLAAGTEGRVLCPALGQVLTLTLPAPVHSGSPWGHRVGGALGGKGHLPPSLGGLTGSWLRQHG